MTLTRLCLLFLLLLLLYLLNGSSQTLGPLLNPEQSALAWQMIAELRLPRAGLAIAAGASLGMAGLLLQTLTRNPLADPGILGINHGAALSVVALYLLIPGQASHLAPVAAASGSLLIIILLWRLAQRLTPVGLILQGIALSALLSALLSYLLLSVETYQIASVLTWLVGNLSGAHPDNATMIAILALCCLTGAYLLCLAISPLILDSRSASMLGVDGYEAAILILAGLLSALSVVAVGSLAFIGLLAPHCARLSGKTTPEQLALPTMLYGACLCIFADLLARTLFAPVQLPFGLLLSIVGVPLFILLLLRQQRTLRTIA